SCAPPESNLRGRWPRSLFSKCGAWCADFRAASTAGHSISMTAPTDSLEAARERIRAAYDPRLLHAAGRTLADLLAEHLRKAEQSESAVMNWADPRTYIVHARQIADSQSTDDTLEARASRFRELAAISLERGINLHDPRYIGHQVPASVPIAGLFDAIGSVTN